MLYLLLITNLSLTTNELPNLGVILAPGTIWRGFLEQTDFKLVVCSGSYYDSLFSFATVGVNVRVDSTAGTRVIQIFCNRARSAAAASARAD